MANPFHGLGMVLPLTPRSLPADGRSPRARPHRPWRPLRVWQVVAFFTTLCLDMAEGSPGIKAPRRPQVDPTVTNSTILIDEYDYMEHLGAGVPPGGPPPPPSSSAAAVAPPGARER